MVMIPQILTLYSRPTCTLTKFELTKIPMTLGRRWDTPTDASAVTFAHQPLSSAMRSIATAVTGLSIS